MKAKRRQELKTNDLAQMIDDLGQSFRQWGVYLIGAIVVVLGVIFAVAYIGQAKVAAIDDAYDDLKSASDFRPMEIRKSDEQIKSQLAQMGALAERTADDNFRAEALRRRGDLALSEAMYGGDRFNPMFLAEARDAFETTLREFSNRPAYRGRALFGLFQVEANEYAADGKPEHKANAVKHLESIRDNPSFNGTPWMKMAIDQLNDMDKVFAQVEFLPGAAPSPTLPAPKADAAVKPEKKTFTYGADQGEFNKPTPTPAPEAEVPKSSAESPDATEGHDDDASADENAPEDSADDVEESENVSDEPASDPENADDENGRERAP
jgi:hypothetical protein